MPTLEELYQSKKGGGSLEEQYLARKKKPPEDPNVPLDDHREDPSFVGPKPRVYLGHPSELASATVGFKEKGEDREQAVRDQYPLAEVTRDNRDTVTAVNPNGEVLNFERPDFGHAVAGAARGLFDLRLPEHLRQDRDVREGQSGDLIRQNAAAALPNIATRGAANAAISAIPGGLALRALLAGGANAAVPQVNQMINKFTPGGDTQTEGQVAKDSVIDGAIGAGSVLLPGALSAGLKRFTSAGRMNQALQELGMEPGAINPTLTKQLATTDKALPIESLGNDDNALLLRAFSTRPKVAKVQGAATQNVADLGDEAASARAGSEQTHRDTLERLVDAQNKARDAVRDARNGARIGVNEADKAASEMNARDSAQRSAQDAEYHQKLASQNEDYAAQARQHSEQVAKTRETDAQAKLRFNQNRAREANVRGANNSEINEKVASAKENYAGRYLQNRVSELEASRPMNTPYKLVPPQRTPTPAAPTRPAAPERPTRAPKEARPVAEPYQEPNQDTLNAARSEATAAKNNVAATNEKYRPIDELQKSLAKSARKIGSAQKPSLFNNKNAIRAGLGWVSGGKTLLAEGAYRGVKSLFSNRATLRVLSDSKLLRQAQELAAKGERVPLQDTSAAESFQQELRTFLAEIEGD